MNTTITLNTPCFYVQGGMVCEGILEDLAAYIETTTRPDGVGRAYYVTTRQRRVDAVTDDNGREIEPEHTKPIWVLAKWATWAGPEVVVDEYDTEAEAEGAAEQTYVYDILNNQEVPVHLDRAGAEDELRMILEDAAE